MKLRISRIILFSRDVARLARFYVDVLGLRITNTMDDGKWIALDAGGCDIAIHSGAGPAKTSARAPKIVFGAQDVEAAREVLVERGARMGPVKTFGDLSLCEGSDPDGNVFQISNRVSSRGAR